MALLQRVRGYALMQRGEHDAARTAFTASLEAGRARDASYDVALSLTGLARLERTTGDGERALALEAESAAMLEPLGVVRLPEFAVTSVRRRGRSR
jgi:ATP/maltotriose-dependent transcriptional regulator MalT